ncbi:MAG: ASPIC/UnbV domain-containing protein [Isosphaeraceae bacterium]
MDWATREVDELEVTWPSGRIDRFSRLAVDREYLIREGEPLGPATEFRP